MKDVERSARVLRNIRDLGVEVAMDDFGTGYSSLGSLAKVPFQKIKIDRSFVRDLASCPRPVPSWRRLSILPKLLA